MPLLSHLNFSSFWILNSVFCILSPLSGAELARESSRYVLEARYDDAERVLERFIADHPDEPAGYLLKAAVLQYECSDYEDPSRGAEYEALLARTEEFSLQRIDRNRNDHWARYYLASAKSLRGVRACTPTSESSLVGDPVSPGTPARGDPPGRPLLGGIAAGRAGAREMSAILAEDPGFCDAYLGTGSYRFWKSVAAGPFRWIPFLRDEREKGIAEVRKAMGCGKLTGPLTNTVLLEMLLEYDPNAARELGERMAAEHPSCRLFAWQLGEAYKKLGRYDSAVGIFTSLADRYARDPRDDGSGQVRCWWKLAVLSRELGKRADCRAYCERILELGRRDTVMKRQKARIDGARRFRVEMNDGEERTRPRRGQ